MRMKPTLKSWLEAGSTLSDVRARQLHWAAELENRGKEHRAKCPLSKRAKARVKKLYNDGLPLCCHAGKAWLLEVVDACWAEHINEFAYEHLGCSTDWRPGGRDFQNGKKKLTKFLDAI